MKLYIYKFLFIICTFSVCNGQFKAYSQFTTTSYISTDSVQVIKNKQIYSQIIAVHNPTESSFKGRVEIHFPRNILPVTGSESSDIQIDANSKRFLPIRYYIGEEVEAGEQKIIFHLIEDSVKINEFSTLLDLKKVRRVQVFPVNPRVLMRHVGDSLHLEARIINNGNQTENIKVVTSFPLIDGGRIPVEKKITIPAFTEQTVRFSKIINKDLLSFEVFSVNIAALYDNNDYASNTIITVNNASGNRVFTSPDLINNHWIQAQNQASLNYRNIGSTSETVNINSNARYNLNNSKIALALDLTRWTNSVLPPLLANTWLEWQRPTMAARVGTIYQNSSDFNINGRGFQTTFNNQDHTQSLEVGLVDKKFNLLDPLETIFDNGFTAFGKFNKQTNPENYYSSQVIYDQTYNGIQNGLFSQTYKYTPQNSNFTLSTKASTALSRFVNDENHETIKPSGALEISLQGKTSDYQWSTSNFISSSYYPGLRRGVLSTNNRVIRSFRKSMFWGAINYYQYQPKFINSTLMFKNNFSNTRAEVGSSMFLSRRVRWNIAQQYNRELGSFYTHQQNDQHQLQSWILSNTFSISSKNQKHLLYLLANYGLSRLSYKKDATHIFQSTLTYSYDALSFNLNFQKGSFLLIEGFMYDLNNQNKQVLKHSLSANYQKNFLNNQLQTNLNIMYNNDSFAGESWVANVRAEYRLNRRTSLYASANSYQYNNNNYQHLNNYFHMGVRQLFSGNSSNKLYNKTGNIEILVFYDINSNGIFDQDDLVASDRIITINNTSFVSQKDGKVIYKRVPYGDYDVTTSGKKWYAPDFTLSVDQKKVKHYLALQETGTIVGKIQYDFDNIKSVEVKPIFSGISIVLKNQNGLEFRTRTNEKGSFLINLPRGKYNVIIAAESLQENVFFEDAIQQIEVKANERKELNQPLILKIKQKEIKIRRFGE